MQLGRDFEFDYHPARNLDEHEGRSTFDYRNRSVSPPVELRGLELSLHGPHQAANAAVALGHGRTAPLGFDVDTAALRRGLAEVRWPARVEVVGRRPTIVLDAAHNVASVEALVKTVDESFTASERILVFATTRDKDARGMLRILLPLFGRVMSHPLCRQSARPADRRAGALAAEIGGGTYQIGRRSGGRLASCPRPGDSGQPDRHNRLVLHRGGNAALMGPDPATRAAVLKKTARGDGDSPRRFCQSLLTAAEPIAVA